VAVASALETGRLLNLELSDLPEPDQTSTGTDQVDDIPAWGRGYAFVLYRRFVADVQSVLDLLGAVCRTAFEDEQEF
jgi:hypothetical protein